MRSQNDIIEIMEAFKAENPNPPTELDYTNAYTLLVAIVLSAQSTDKGVNKATKRLFEATDTPQKTLDMGIDTLKEYIKTIGLYNNKALNIIKMSNDLISKFNSEVPNNRDDLVSLAGVGRKTANVFLNVWANEPTIAVDTHVLRVSKRLELSDGGDNPIKVEKDLEQIVPEIYQHNLSHWLVLFGRYVCKAKKPNCAECPIYNLCHSTDKI